MKTFTSIAIIFIATYAISTRASAEEVYRSGDAYSQKPCANAVAVDVQDSRTPAQKAESDAKTRHETAQVTALDKARQKEEAQRHAENAKLAAAQAKKDASKPEATTTRNLGVKSTTASTGKAKKKTTRMKKEPVFFVANSPDEKQKTPKKRGK
jgi:hypothetical protein